MQFTVKKEEFLKILLLVSHQILSKPALPILANIQLKAEREKLKVLATNLELGSIFALDAKIKREGEITIPAKILTEFVATVPGKEVFFELENTEVKITAGNSLATLPTISVEEYPAIPKIEKVLAEIPGKEVEEIISRSVFAAAVDSVRPILTGVLIEFAKKTISFVATDGYRLSFEKTSIDTKTDEVKIVIPARTLTQLMRVVQDVGGVVKILHDPAINQVGFETKNTTLISRLTEGNFPDWQKIIPENFKTKAVVAKKELLQAVKAGSVFAKESGNIIELQLLKAGLEIKTQSGQGSLTSKVPAKVTGENLEIAFNWRYLTEALQAVPGDIVNAEFVESLSPAKFTSAKTGSTFFHIVMPVRT